MQKVCVFSGKTTDLNTSLNVRLDDGTTVEAWVSDEYADTATPKAIKEAYLKMSQKLDAERKALLEQAARLGLKLVDESAMPQSSPAANIRVQQAAPQQHQSTIVPDTGNRVISGRKADNVHANPNITHAAAEVGQLIGGVGSEYDVRSESKSSVDLKNGEVAEIGMVKSRGGQVAIPVKRVGPAGTTTVRVVEGGGDPQLQKRFRDMAKYSQASDAGNVSYAREGYDVHFRRCTMCNGSGTAIDGKTCRKCNGMGEIEVSRF
jgi:hypothetical protein